MDELKAEMAQLTSRLAGEREVWSRLRVARATVTEVLAEWARRDVAEPVTLQEPDVLRGIVKVIVDASGPMQAKQIVPRIGLPAVTAKIDRWYDGFRDGERTQAVGAQVGGQ
ncbi:hypothetical protein ACFWWC_39120 [Streptomyces sp. NPDC058642]|uniref:hypothetical protein n=1 Tax=Streptomyces sp. NPDC058642 TaxID=3346572 RepID=UPI00364A77BD